MTIEGEGTVGKTAAGENMAIDGTVRVTVSDLAVWPRCRRPPRRFQLRAPPSISSSAAGSPIEALVIEATVPVFNVKIAEQNSPRRRGAGVSRCATDASSSTPSCYSAPTPSSPSPVLPRSQVRNVSISTCAPRAGRAAAIVRVRRTRGSATAPHHDGTTTAPRVLGTTELLVDAQIKFPGFRSSSTRSTVWRASVTAASRSSRSAPVTVGGGTVVAGGLILLDGMKPKSARTSLQGTDVSILSHYEGLDCFRLKTSTSF